MILLAVTKDVIMSIRMEEDLKPNGKIKEWSDNGA